MTNRKQTRRNLLFGFGRCAIAATASMAAPVTVEARDDDGGHFEHPSEYLAALQAIGWQARAMYQRLEGGRVHRMGVHEDAPSEDWLQETWGKYHAISMRMPIQMAADMPQGDWWERVWEYLYERGFREDVTPPKLATRLMRGSQPFERG